MRETIGMKQEENSNGQHCASFLEQKLDRFLKKKYHTTIKALKKRGAVDNSRLHSFFMSGQNMQSVATILMQLVADERVGMSALLERLETTK